MIVAPKEISNILRKYGKTEVKGNKILSDMRLFLKLNVSEDYLYELMENEILVPAKPSSTMGEYLFNVCEKNLRNIPTLVTTSGEEVVKVLATYPSGMGFEEIEGISKLYPLLIMLLSGAKRSIDIINPYYTEIGFQKVANALIQASLRNVEIRLVSRSVANTNRKPIPDVEYLNFIKLLKEKGNSNHIHPRIFGKEGAESKKINLHAKVICVDNKTVYLGSANITGASLMTNLEIGVLLTSEPAKEVHELFERAWENSVKV